jgi:hypothetical protein
LDGDEDPINNDILTFDSTGANFSWQTPAELNLLEVNGTGASLTAVDAITGDSATAFFDAGIVEVTFGGTGVSDPTDHAVLVGSGAAALTPLTVGTNGQLLIGQTTADPAFTTMGGDATIDESGALTIATDAIEVAMLNTDSVTMDAVDADGNFTSLTGNWTISTGQVNFGGAADFEIPNAAAPTVDTDGHIAIDTTGADQLKYFSTAERVMTYEKEKCFTLETPVDGDDDVPIWSPKHPITITDVYCRVQGGTSIAVTLGDGTNYLEAVTCDAGGEADDGSIANGAFIADERMEFDMAAPSGAVDWVNYCITYTVDAQ